MFLAVRVFARLAYFEIKNAVLIFARSSTAYRTLNAMIVTYFFVAFDAGRIFDTVTAKNGITLAAKILREFVVHVRMLEATIYTERFNDIIDVFCHYQGFLVQVII